MIVDHNSILHLKNFNSCGQSFVVHVSFPQLADSTKEFK